MLFELLIAAEAGKVGDEVRASAGTAPVGAIRSMLEVRVLTDAGGAPLVHVEALTTHQPVLADLLRAPWNELECFALALGTVVLEPAILKEGLVVRFEQMTAEASRILANSHTLILPLRKALPSHIDA